MRKSVLWLLTGIMVCLMLAGSVQALADGRDVFVFQGSSVKNNDMGIISKITDYGLIVTDFNGIMLNHSRKCRSNHFAKKIYPIGTAVHDTYQLFATNT